MSQEKTAFGQNEKKRKLAISIWRYLLPEGKPSPVMRKKKSDGRVNLVFVLMDVNSVFFFPPLWHTSQFSK